MKIAFIGGGNMGEAMLAAILEKGLSTPEDISAGDIREERRQYLKDKYGVAVAENNVEVIGGKDVIILAVKPQNLSEVMADLKGCLEPAQLVISIIAGARINTMSQGLNHNCIVRVMPNTPALVREGMSVISHESGIDERSLEVVKLIFSFLGRVLVLPEKLMDAVTAISGCGPAYGFSLIQAMADGGVRMGIPREEALILSAQTILGSAKMVLENESEPITLREKVTSPGGSTIEAVHILEKNGFAGIVMDAIEAAKVKSEHLGKIVK